MPLSHNAKVPFMNGEVGQAFWYPFDASHSDISRKKVVPQTGEQLPVLKKWPFIISVLWLMR